MPDVFAPPPKEEHFPIWKKYLSRFQTMEPAANIIRIDTVGSYREFCEKKDFDKLASTSPMATVAARRRSLVSSSR